LARRIFRDAFNAAPACGRAPIALSPFCTSPIGNAGAAHFILMLYQNLAHFIVSSGPRRSALPSCAGARVRDRFGRFALNLVAFNEPLTTSEAIWPT